MSKVSVKTKNILIFDWNSVLTDLRVVLEQRGHTILPMDGKAATLKKADVLVLWNETESGGWKDVIKSAQKQGKKVILVQHGRKGVSRIYPPFNDKLQSDMVCVWGEKDKLRLVRSGVTPDRIIVTGTSIWSHLKPRKPHEGFNVVFSPEHWDADVVENLIVASELRKLKGVNVITKIIKGHQLPENYQNPVISDRHAPDHLSIVAETLSIADVVVSISESTFEMLAQSLDIPIVIADVWIPKACQGDEKYKEYQREYSNACTKVKLKDLNNTIMQELKNPSRLSRERKEIVVADGGKDILSPVYRIINVIETICN